MRLIDADAFIEMMEEKCDPKSILDPWVFRVCRGGVTIMPTVDAVPVEWIRDEIDWLKGSDNVFAKLGAGQLEAMLKRWKDGNDHG